MRDLKKIIMGIMIVFCLLMPIKARGSEIIPVRVSDQSLKVKKFKEKKREKGEKYYFYCQQTQSLQCSPLLSSGVIKANKDETPDQVFNRLLRSSEELFRCCVVVVEFNRLE